MTELQVRVLLQCEINFYEATYGPSEFQRALRALGWKANPDWSLVGNDTLRRLVQALRKQLRLPPLKGASHGT